MLSDRNTPARFPTRWIWFVGIYAASVATLAVVAYGLRALIGL